MISDLSAVPVDWDEGLWFKNTEEGTYLFYKQCLIGYAQHGADVAFLNDDVIRSYVEEL